MSDILRGEGVIRLYCSPTRQGGEDVIEVGRLSRRVCCLCQFYKEDMNRVCVMVNTECVTS